MWIIVILLLLVAFIHFLDAMLYGKSIRNNEITYASAAIPANLEGYRIAFITDTHDVLEEDIDTFCRYLEEHPVDIILLGGDHEESTVRLFDRLAQVETPDGIWGVEGNHDEFSFWLSQMEKHGFHPLNDEGVHIQEGFYLAGITDLWTNDANLSAALSGQREGDFVLLLAHNPDVAMNSDSHSAHLQLSGHTHGGHVTLFGVWRPLTWKVSRYGHRFSGGWAHIQEGLDVYVSNGAGYDRKWWCPRVFAHPEMTIVTLQTEAA